MDDLLKEQLKQALIAINERLKALENKAIVTMEVETRVAELERRVSEIY